MEINRFCKFLLFTFMSMCHLSSYGQSGYIELSLKCKVRVQYTFSHGKEVNNAELIVNISEDKGSKYKFIRITSSNEIANDISVSTGRFSHLKGVESIGSDRSDENTYDITSNDSFPGNRSSNNRIYLNRNNGEIIVSKEFTSPNGVSQTSISGTCEKIDTTKKKF